MFAHNSLAGLVAKVALATAYVLAVAVGEWVWETSGDGGGLLPDAFSQGALLFVRFRDEVCTFTNVFVGDGAIRVASRCSEDHGGGGSR